MAESILVDTAAAATFVGVRPTTLRDWATRYQLTRYGTRMRRLYDLRELQTIMDKREAADLAALAREEHLSTCRDPECAAREHATRR